MRTRGLLYTTIGLVLLGGLIASLWLYVSDGSAVVNGLAQVQPEYLIPLFLIMVFCIFVRFLRWHFLLRRANICLPTRPSFSIFLASLTGIATPLHVGEVIRSILVRKRFGIPLRFTTWVLIVERLLDAVALGLIGLVATNVAWMRGLMALVIVAAGLGGLILGWGGRIAKIPASVIAQLSTANTLIYALGISLAGWLPATLLVGLAAASVHLHVPSVFGMAIFSTSTLLGGLTLTPAGVGATGSLAIIQLRELGLSLSSIVVVVSLVRLMTVGVSFAVGVIFLMLELWTLRHWTGEDSAFHFNEIAEEYRAQFSEHIWQHLLERKIELLTSALPDPPPTAGLGLDLGCGLGEHCLAMKALGYSVMGLDVAQDLVQKANRMGVEAEVGNALAMPFPDGHFDFIYTVGVLHHLSGAEARQAVCREVARVLKPAGLFIIHETNPHNLLFRFYMGYLFPLLHSIDEGTEHWIEPSHWSNVERMRLIELKYCTFLPDFTPSWLMRPLLAAERWLEASPFRSYSAHYVAVLRREPLPSGCGPGVVDQITMPELTTG